MEESDIIISGINNLSELQGRKNILLENVKTTNDKTIDIERMVNKFPSYVDKCNYLKSLSEKFVNRAAEASDKANDIVEIVSEMKNYVETSGLDQCRNGNSIKQKFLKDLQIIQNSAYMIVRPEQHRDYEQYSFSEGPIVAQGGKRKKTRKNLYYKKNIKKYRRTKYKR